MLVLKQYGELRTGTNLLRLLLLLRPDVLVLMHVLGDKHSPPAPLDRLWAEISAAGDDPYEFVRRATATRPATTTDLTDPRQQAHLATWSASIADAYRNGQLPILISVKAPRAWLTSLQRFECDQLRRPPTPPKEAIERYVSNYRSWLALADRGHPVLVVRNEELQRSAATTLTWLADQLGLDQRTGPLPCLDLPVRPTGGDHEPPAFEPFEIPARSPAGVARFGPDDLERAARRVDPELLALLGYRPGGISERPAPPELASKRRGG